MEPLPAEWVEASETPSWCLVLAASDYGDCQAAHTAAKNLISRLNADLASDNPLSAEITLGHYVWQAAPHTASGYTKSAFVDAPVGKITVTGIAGTVAINGFEQHPSRTGGVRVRELQRTAPDFDEAVKLFELAGDDIRKLFVVYEHIEARFGKSGPARAGKKHEVEDFRSTANNAPNVRHKGGQRPMKKPPMSGAASRELIRSLLMAWTDELHPI
jgi:hypothetical protein